MLASCAAALWLIAAATGVDADPTVGPLVQVSGPSLFDGCTADSTQNGAAFVGSEVEPWVDVDPSDASHLVAAWQQDRWSNGAARGIGSAVSRDGGATWRSTFVPGLSACSGGVFERATDPWVSISVDGTVYLSAYVFDRTAGQDAVTVSASSDGGETWGAPAVVASGPDGNSFNDKEAVTADPHDADVAYLTWSRFTSPNGVADDSAYAWSRAIRGGLAISRTTDGGATWEPHRMIFESTNLLPTFAQIVVLPNGDLVDVFEESRLPYSKPNGNGTEHTLHVSMTRSTDRGLTWSRPKAIAPAGRVGTTDPESGRPVRAGGLDVAVDPVSGRLHVAWTYAFPGSAVDSIALSTSGDGGRTWSAPMKVNRTPTDVPMGAQQAFNPSVAVSSNGAVAVSYSDLRTNDPAPQLATSVSMALCQSTADCASPAGWEERMLTDVPFDLRKAPYARGYFVGDYTGLVAAGSDVLAAFTMPHAADTASVFLRRVTTN
ncbi:MAG TPA: sialidase family protein [Acidimicrobiales bacterium]|nr:sialidase family protein [Acidimicrobiales bacterium]